MINVRCVTCCGMRKHFGVNDCRQLEWNELYDMMNIGWMKDVQGGAELRRSDLAVSKHAEICFQSSVNHLTLSSV